MENDLLGTNKKAKKGETKGLKGKKPGGEEAWKRIIAKYISSIRDAFLGLNFYSVAFDGLVKPGNVGANENQNPVGFFSPLGIFKSLKTNECCRIWQPTGPLFEARNKPRTIWVFDTVYGPCCVTHTAWSLLMRNGSLFAGETEREVWEAKRMSVNYAIINRRGQITTFNEFSSDLLRWFVSFFRTSVLRWQFIVPDYFRFMCSALDAHFD